MLLTGLKPNNFNSRYYYPKLELCCVAWWRSLFWRRAPLQFVHSAPKRHSTHIYSPLAERRYVRMVSRGVLVTFCAHIVFRGLSPLLTVVCTGTLTRALPLIVYRGALANRHETTYITLQTQTLVLARMGCLNDSSDMTVSKRQKIALRFSSKSFLPFTHRPSLMSVPTWVASMSVLPWLRSSTGWYAGRCPTPATDRLFSPR